MVSGSLKQALLAFAGIAVLCFASSAEAQQDALLSQAKATVDPSPEERAGAPSASPEARLEAYLAGRGASPETVQSLAPESDHVAPDGTRFVKLEQRIGELRVHGGFSKAAFNEEGALIHVMERLAPADAPVTQAWITPAQALGIALDYNFPNAPVPALQAAQGAISTFAADPYFFRAPTVEKVVVAEGADLQEGFLVVNWGAESNRLYHTVVNGIGDIVENVLRTANDVGARMEVTRLGWVRETPGGTVIDNQPEGSEGLIIGGSVDAAGLTWWDVDFDTGVDGWFRQDRMAIATPPPPNNPPTASIAADRTSGNAPMTVNFDGTGSTDGDGHIVSYAWDFDDDGTTDATSANASFTYETAGTYTARLTVTDDDGATDDATASIFVDLPPPSGGLDRYRYFDVSPFWDNAHFGPPTIIDGPGSGNAESPIGWLLGAQRSIEIQGNNVQAYIDRDADDAPDAGGSPIVSGEFVTIGDIFLEEPTTIENQELAVQNLFVYTNRIHDELYRYGFVEGAGNFQDDNFGKGGLGSDRVLAEAQDGSAINTSSFATPADGQSPRMQLHLWDTDVPMHDGALDPDLIYHEYGHGLTWRMIGGMSGDVSGAVGEGISDGFAVVSNDNGKVNFDSEWFLDDVFAEYAGNYEIGIRSLPYITHRDTIRDFDPARGVHRNGEILGSTLWNLWRLYVDDGKSKDDFMGNLVGGMNFIAPGPDFFDVRDGMLAQAPDSRDCLIWDAFAMHGIGVGGSMDATGTTVNASFDRPAACPLPPNTAPNAQISCIPLGRYSGVVPFTLDCHGGFSSDDDGKIAAFAWDFDGDGVTDATTKAASFTYQTPGTYPMRLEVTDDDGAVGEKTITIEATAPSPPTARILANPTTGPAPLNVQFDGTDSTDTDGQIVSYAWDFDNDGTTDATSANASFTYQNAGAYTARLTVTDDDGATDDATTSIVVDAAPPPSGGFQVRARIEITRLGWVRETPGGTVIDNQPEGAQGLIIGGPVDAAGLTWWGVDFDTGVNGWFRQDRMAVAP